MWPPRSGLNVFVAAVRRPKNRSSHVCRPTGPNAGLLSLICVFDNGCSNILIELYLPPLHQRSPGLLEWPSPVGQKSRNCDQRWKAANGWPFLKTETTAPARRNTFSCLLLRNGFDTSSCPWPFARGLYCPVGG